MNKWEILDFLSFDLNDESNECCSCSKDKNTYIILVSPYDEEDRLILCAECFMKGGDNE